MFRLFFIIFISSWFIFFSLAVSAQEETGVVISPHIIDETVQARDILDYEVTVRNNTDRKVSIYPVVNDISATAGAQEFINPNLLDKTVSLARWIEFPRGVIELWPGEEKTVPLSIKVNLGALPGQRYAAITFPEGNNRPLAEENMRSTLYPQLLVNITVAENIVEKAQVSRFRAAKNIFFRPPADFIVSFLNSGNRAITPAGSVYVYNRRGEELEKLALNEAAKQIAPGESVDFSVVWADINGFGRFKARLEAEYGEADKRDLNDTVFFWVLPAYALALYGGGLLLAVALIATVIYRQLYHYPGPKRSGRIASHGIVDLRVKKP
ncbi:MAG: DUF916 domain-containing protein [Planctomycetes bacterium]|jgi:hypothetical protein|nr:DUF916 domain-containing protein [Planctomycetota bacterium]